MLLAVDVPNEMRVNRDIVVRQVTIERVQKPKPRVSICMIFKLERMALDLRHCQQRAVFEQNRLWADMPDIGQVLACAALGSSVVTEHCSCPVHGFAVEQAAG
jgi:hypothetical protein